MIILTKLGGKQIMINELHIETASETPDTVIVMTNGHTYIVSENLETIMEKCADFQRMQRRRMVIDKDARKLERE